MDTVINSLYVRLNDALGWIDALVWGLPMIVIILGVGIFAMVYFRGVQFRLFTHAWKLISGRYDDPDDPGEISHFKALSSAVSGTVGVGNIAGVAAAIAAGGPGSVLWMWVTALFGMGLKFTSCTLAVRYRKIDENGVVSGGPMHYIEQGLGPAFKPLAMAFAAFGAIASFGIGNMLQANKVSESMMHISEMLLGDTLLTGTAFQLGQHHVAPLHLLTGVIGATLIGLVIIGGIRRIGRVASMLVPAMCGTYILFGMILLLRHITQVDDALWLIITDAFSGEAMAGGALGTVIRYGVARGIFSNEAGMGSAPMSHATAQTRYPIREGLVAMLGPFIDTLCVCTMTALVIVTMGIYKTGAEDVTLTALSFEKGLEFLQVTNLGNLLVACGIVLFAFSSMLLWCYYGERCVEYLLGRRSLLPYRVLFLLAVVVGSVVELGMVWTFSDIANALMAIPNLIALVLLAPVVGKLLKEYLLSDAYKVMPKRQ